MARQLYTTSTVLEMLEDDELIPVEEMYEGDEDMYEGSDEEFDLDVDEEYDNEMEEPEEMNDTSFEQGLEAEVELDQDEGDGIALTTANSDDVVTVTKVKKNGKKLAKSSIVCIFTYFI